MAMRYWAVRLGEYVEIRTATSRPVAITSKITRRSTLSCTGKLVLKQTFYSGGKPLGVLKYARFHTLTHTEIKLNNITEVTKEMKQLCLKRVRTYGW